MSLYDCDNGVDIGGESPCLLDVLDEQGRVPDRPREDSLRIEVKRVYDPASTGDGYRVLVDRLWPRGLTKQAAKIDRWMREVAPSDALRRWFGHDVARWDEFHRRYSAELSDPDRRVLVDQLAQQARRGSLTLLYAAHDAEHNNALVLRDAVLSALRQQHS